MKPAKQEVIVIWLLLL
jgi:hypothetical protein